MFNLQPIELGIISRDHSETRLVLDANNSTLAVGENVAISLPETEIRMLGVLAAQPNVPFTLSELRLATGEKDLKPIHVMERCLKKAPLLSQHLLAIVYHKTQYFSFLDWAGNTDEFEYELEQKQKEERILRFVPEANDFEYSQAKDLLRRHARQRKIVKAALGATAASSAIIGYTLRNKHK